MVMASVGRSKYKCEQDLFYPCTIYATSTWGIWLLVTLGGILNYVIYATIMWYIGYLTIWVEY